MDHDHRSMLKESAAAMDIPLDERALDLFAAYYRELTLWNKKMNLTSLRSPRDIIIRHFADSLTPLPYIDCPDGRLLDIGSGGGFPGIPLKIACPGLQVYLLEASRKKTSFLKHLIRQLQLTHTAVIHARAEAAMTDASQQHIFDTVVSRAAFKLSQLLEMSRVFLRPGGLLLVMKGPRGDAEMDLSGDSGFHGAACHDIRIPFVGERRKIITFQRDS
jgi:16S rRNA (guanine527-N7)-methyltransferase